MKQKLVKNWMTTRVMSADRQMPILRAHKLMRMNGIRRLPIVNRHGKLIGIVTRSDIRQAEPSGATTLNVWEINYLLSQLKVNDIMTKEPLTVTPDDSLRTAAKLLHEHKIGALPVVDEQHKPVGIITESDIFRALISWFDEEAEAEAVVN